MRERHQPGRYGPFGGRYVAEALWTPLESVARAFDAALADRDFIATFERWLDHRIGRPTPVSHLEALSSEIGGAQIWLKREDLCQGGAFCINAAVLQVLLARFMGRKWVVGESATGDFGVALGSIAAAMGLKVRIFMGREDFDAEPLNVQRMRELGVHIETVDANARGRKRACSEALRYWATHSDTTLYCASSLAMPDPYPRLLEYGLSVIGAETHVQLKRRGCEPEYLVAPVGSGAFAAGLFSEFVKSSDIQIVGVQAAGDGQSDHSAASLVDGRPGVFLGTYSYLLQDEAGQIVVPGSVAGGLCMPHVGPQHAQWAAEGRVHYVSVTDNQASTAVNRLARSEGILVSLESGHALAYALRLAPTLAADEHIVVGISAGGVRDLERLARLNDEEGAP